MNRIVISVVLGLLFFAVSCGNTFNEKSDKDVIAFGDIDSKSRDADIFINNDGDILIKDDGSDSKYGDDSDNHVGAVCGNGITESEELCDSNVMDCVNINSKLYKGGKAKCSSDCKSYKMLTCETIQQCGNDVKEGTEVCDGDVKECDYLDPSQFSGGQARCNSSCTGFNLQTCQIKKATCGNGILESGEYCDGDVKDCAYLNPGQYIGGKAKCSNDCTGYKTLTCETKPVCGNGIIEPGEYCDGDVKDCIAIDSYKFSSGKAKCNTVCSGYRTQTCDSKPVCGNGVKESGEYCDRDSKSCTAIDPYSYSGGTAYCNSYCSGYDMTYCVYKPVCGNGKIESGEVCDGDIKDCAAIDPNQYGGGKAKCNSDCKSYKTLTCEKKEICGNGVVGGNEICEINQVINCVNIDKTKFTGGKAACMDNCFGWDTDTCVGSSSGAYGTLQIKGDFPYILDYEKVNNDPNYLGSYPNGVLASAVFNGYYGLTSKPVPSKAAQSNYSLAIHYSDTQGNIIAIIQQSGDASQTFVNPMVQMVFASDYIPVGQMKIDPATANNPALYLINYTNLDSCILAIAFGGVLNITKSVNTTASEGGQLAFNASNVKIYYPSETPVGDISGQLAGTKICPKE